MRRIILMGLVLLFIGTPSLDAADIKALLGQADSSHAKGQYVDTVLLLREALVQVWNQAPLTVRNINYVADQPSAYGIYQPYDGDEFDPVNPIMLYCEPIGYTVKKQGEIYTFALSADFSVADEQGDILGGQQNFGRWSMRSRAFNTEFMMYFTFNLKGLPPGRYKLMVTLHDLNSTKTAAFEKGFKIR